MNGPGHLCPVAAQAAGSHVWRRRASPPSTLLEYRRPWAVTLCAIRNVVLSSHRFPSASPIPFPSADVSLLGALDLCVGVRVVWCVCSQKEKRMALLAELIGALAVERERTTVFLGAESQQLPVKRAVCQPGMLWHLIKFPVNAFHREAVFTVSGWTVVTFQIVVQNL